MNFGNPAFDAEWKWAAFFPQFLWISHKRLHSDPGVTRKIGQLLSTPVASLVLALAPHPSVVAGDWGRSGSLEVVYNSGLNFALRPDWPREEIWKERRRESNLRLSGGLIRLIYMERERNKCGQPATREIPSAMNLSQCTVSGSEGSSASSWRKEGKSGERSRSPNSTHKETEYSRWRRWRLEDDGTRDRVGITSLAG